MVNAASGTASTRIYFQIRLRKSGALALMAVIAISSVSPSIVGLAVPSSLSCALPVIDLPAAIPRERSYYTSSPYSPWDWPSWVPTSLSINPLGLSLFHSRSCALPACTLSSVVPRGRSYSPWVMPYLLVVSVSATRFFWFAFTCAPLYVLRSTGNFLPSGAILHSLSSLR